MDTATKFVVAVGGGMLAIVAGWIAYDNMPERPKVVAVETPKSEPPVAKTEPRPKAESLTEPAKPMPAPDPRRFSYKDETPGVMDLQEFRFKYSSYDAEYDASKTPGAVATPGEDRFTFFNEERTIAGEPVRYATYHFLDGTLASITLSVGGDGIDRVAEAIRDKNGPPTSVGEYITWEADTSRIEIDRGLQVVRYEDPRLVAELRKRERLAKGALDESKKAAAAKDL